MLTCQESSTIAGTLQILNKYQSSSQHLQMSPVFTDSLCSILPSSCWEISVKQKSDQHVCVCVCVCVHACVHIRVLSCIWLSVTPWTIAHQAPLFMGIFQARILEWVAMPSSRASSQPRDWTPVSCLLYWQVGSLPPRPPGKPKLKQKRECLGMNLFYSKDSWRMK